MALKLNAICSECLTMHKTKLDLNAENIQCPACGHAMKNLPESELTMIESSIKGQRRDNIVAMVGFGIAVVCFFIWVFNQHPSLYHGTFMGEPAPEDDTMKTIMPITMGIGFLLTMVFGILGARKRFVLEF